MSPILLVFVTSIPCLSIQPSPLRKHATGYNLGSKWLNYAKEKLKGSN
jgi:hypothetical protein